VALRVLLVSDDPLSRGGLLMLLSGREDLEVVGMVASDEFGFDPSNGGAPQVVVWDVGEGSPDNLEKMREVNEAGLPVVAVVADEERAAAAREAGAQGLLFREADGERLAAAIHAATLGLVVVEEALLDVLRRPGSSSGLRLPEALTPRELEVLQLLAQGLSNKEIAQRLGTSEHTAKFHVNSILGKLGARSRTEAIVLAARAGIILL